MLQTFQKWVVCKGLYLEYDRPSVLGKRREKHIQAIFRLKRIVNAIQIDHKIISDQQFHLVIAETLTMTENSAWSSV